MPNTPRAPGAADESAAIAAARSSGAPPTTQATFDAPTVRASWGDAPTVRAPSGGAATGSGEGGAPRSLVELTARYEPTHVLGAGGMGEVTACRDVLIGREVAVKSLSPELDGEPVSRARFVAEARLQGQLEHPAIVPVYDVAEGARGVPFFVMKRVRGSSLEDLLTGLGQADPRVAASYGQHKLLSAFCSVCMAVDFAHAHGVVHRDLKPQNVMLGDFGEVYVLDWGVARQSQTRPADVPPSVAGQVIVGTPGYIPPEQLRGATSGTPAGDVFALGAILFEILAFEPLVPRGTLEGMVEATLAGADARARARAPDRNVPPELEAICVRATAPDADERYPTARALCEAVERYLEGDRDLARRREASADHATRADAALRAALAGATPFEQGRAQAMKELNRALALDPDNGDAMRTLLRVVTELPREVPAEVEARAAASDRGTLQMGARLSSVTPLLYLLMLPVVLVLGVRDPWLVGAVLVASAGAALAGHLVAKRAAAAASRWQYAILALRALVMLALTRMFGPLVMVPALATAFGVAMQVHPKRFMRRAAAWVACLAVGVPVLLEWAGVLPSSYAFADGRMAIVPQMHELPAVPTSLLLLVASIATIVTASAFVGRVRRSLSEAHLRLQLTAWHFERMLPDRVPGRD